MSKVYYTLASGTFAQDWSDIGLIATDDNWDNVASIVGYRGDGLAGGTGVNPATITGDSSVIDVNANVAISSSTYSTGGITEVDTIADPTIAFQGSGTARAPYSAFYLDATGRQDVTFTARLRDLDTGTTATQPVAVQYRASDTGAWINLPDAFVANANIGTDTLINVKLPTAANDQALLEIRVITADAVGSDAMIGIDDIMITSDALVVAPPPTDPWINELHYDNDGGDIGEGVEIAGVAGTDLTGWSLVLYNGSGGAPYGTIALSGTIDDEGNGYGALSFAGPSSGIQNGSPDGVALVDAKGRVLQFLSYEGTFVAVGGAANGMLSTDIGVVENASPVGQSLQLTGTGSDYADFTWQQPATASMGDLNAGQFVIAPTGLGQITVGDVRVVEGDVGTTDMVFTVRRAGGSASAATVDYNVVLDSADANDFAPGTVLSGTISFGVGESSKQVVLQVTGDTTAEYNETVRLVLSNPVGNVAIADDTGIGTIVNDDPIELLIGEIQGAGHRSGYVGQSVITTGIVTAVDTNGFYLQDMGDGDARTSDGVFVFTGSAPTVAVGDAATVEGTVTEYVAAAGSLSLTEITAPIVTVLSSGNALPDAVLIGTGGLVPPTSVTDDDGLTSYDPTTDGIDFYEALEGMRVTIDQPLVVSRTNNFGETYVVASGGADATGVNARGGITIAPGDFNPERIQIDDDAGVFAGFAPNYTTGDRLTDVTGVMNYSFNAYEVIVTEAVSTVVDTDPTREVATITGDADRVSIATYNVENLDPTDTKFDLLASDIVYNLRAPDIVAVQEIQDADGAGRGADLSGQATADKLIAAIQAAGGPTYLYVEIAPTVAGTAGGEPGGNIRNGYLYNADRVGYVTGSAMLIEDAAYNGSRKPLVAQFTFNEQTITTINMHSTSRGGSDAQFGSTQPPADAGDAARTAQAAAVRAYVNDQLATDPRLNIAVMGDFNGFTFENAIQTLVGDGVLTDLNTLLAPEERYSYIFDGNSQQIDHILVTGGLYAGAAVDSVHINAEQAPDMRATDHDPQVATFYLPRPNAAPTDLALSNDTVAENQAAGTVVGTLRATDAPTDTLTYTLLDDAGGRFAVDAATGVVTTTTAFDYEATTGYTIVGQATDQGGLSTSASFAIAVTDVNEAPVAMGDTVAVNEDATTGNLVPTLLANDNDPDAGTTLRIAWVDTTSTQGSVVFDAATQTLRYVADADAFDALKPGATATDTFRYTVIDNGGLTSTASVTVTVTGIDDGIVKVGTIFSDKLVGTGGEDTLFGLIGNDTLYGLGGHDALWGGIGNDTLDGGDGNDMLSGGIGNDVLIGGNGDDRLSGDIGNDVMTGGAGADSFHLGLAGGTDTITDFDVALDRLVLENGIDVKGYRVSDVNRDGHLDLTIIFKSGGGQVTLLDVAHYDMVTIDHGNAGLFTETLF